jgi:hypothetical protein
VKQRVRDRRAEEQLVNEIGLASWVERYVPGQIGPGDYSAHITVGFAALEDVAAIEAEPFDAFGVHPAAVAIYQLGNGGAARALLKTWPIAT